MLNKEKDSVLLSYNIQDGGVHKLYVLGFCSTYFEVANERVASNHIVVFAQRFLELLLGKQEISDEEHED